MATNPPHDIPTEPRELVRGLMRGNLADFKQGYSHASATGAATTYLHLDTDAVQALSFYAHGYALGMQLAYGDVTLAAAVQDGLRDGLAEDPGLIMPGPTR